MQITYPVSLAIPGLLISPASAQTSSEHTFATMTVAYVMAQRCAAAEVAVPSSLLAPFEKRLVQNASETNLTQEQKDYVWTTANSQVSAIGITEQDCYGVMELVSAFYPEIMAASAPPSPF